MPLAFWSMLWVALGGPVELHWEAPLACPTASVVEQAVVEALHGGHAGVQTRVWGRIEPQQREPTRELHHLTLRIDRDDAPDVVMELSDPDCEALAEAAALKIAAAIELQTSSRPRPEDRRCAPVERALRPLAPRCVGVFVGGGAQWGPLPGWGGGLMGGVAMLWNRWRLHVEGHGWFERITAGPPPRAGLDLAGVALIAEARLGFKRVEIPLGGGIELGALRGRGVDLALPRRDALFWMAAVARAGLAWSPHPRIAIFTRLTGLLSVFSLRFVVDETSTVYQVPRWGARFGAGVEVRIFGGR